MAKKLRRERQAIKASLVLVFPIGHIFGTMVDIGSLTMTKKGR
jgi:hypothetical protein